MKVLTVLAIVAIVIGALMHFWPGGHPPPVASRTSEKPSPEASTAPVPRATTAVERPPSASAHASERVAPPAAADRTRVSAAVVDLRAPKLVRHGDSFSVMIDVHAARAMRRLEFAVTYEKSILRLLNSAPGVFVQREGTSVQFEESSDGHLLVRIDLESGAISGSGSVATLEFQALRRGVSPLAVQDVTHVEVGGQAAVATHEVREASIVVE